MNKILLLTILLYCFSSEISAQYTKEDEKPKKENPLADTPFKDRLFTGGNLGFGVSNNVLFLDISPIIGYKVTEKLGAGIGLRYSLIRNMLSKVNYTNYGGSVFARYKLIPQAFLHAELEGLRSYDYGSVSLKRAMAYMGFVGAGYSIGEGFSFSIVVLYDLINHPNSPYQNAYLLGATGPPVILRGGFTIGF